MGLDRSTGILRVESRFSARRLGHNRCGIFTSRVIGITLPRPCRWGRSRICVALCLSGKCFANPYPSTLKTALTSNLAVDQRFANGTQGRLLQWHPGACESKRKALPAYCPDLLARFCKETSLSKSEMLPDIGKPFSYIVNYIPTSRP